MFVTCQYIMLDPATGCMQFANAGHNLPYRRTQNGVLEMRATGMPLGLMPDMTYDEKEILITPGESVLFYSDGLVEAHNVRRKCLAFSIFEIS
jgi:serine phosphatase RsbU (regulator of sigma subunit)